MEVGVRELNHLNTLRQAAVSSRTINDFLAENGPKPMEVYAADGKTKLYDTVVDWDTLRVAKGIAYGLYLEMRTENAQVIANEILLQEGIPQRITARQNRFLYHFDQKYDL